MLISQKSGNCKLCGSHNIWHYHKSEASAVTSDSKIVKRPIDIRYCRECSNLFKNRDTRDIDIIEKINESMVLYGFNGISEHRVAFDKYSGGIERSRHQLEYISKNIELDNTRYILDYGCHYGAFLSNFNVYYPNRFLYGYDIANKYKNHINSISEKSFFTTDFQDLRHVKFDLISVSHVLEHVEDPLSTLQFLKARLKNSGFLFLQLVNAEENPFASLIFEQHYHFTCYGIKRLLELCGLEIINFNTSWIAKEISLLIRDKKQKGGIPKRVQYKRISKEQTDSTMNENYELLKQMEKNLYNTKTMGLSVGVFGTSIAGTWAGSILDTSLKYYVDEDTTKQGKKHLGINVIPPEKVENDDIVYILLPENAAVKVVERLSSKNRATYITPPFNIALDLKTRPYLDFYKKNKISPVTQDISDLKKHFERRASLYRHLGIVPALLKDKTIIEFGPGSGHNAIYTNSLQPSRYVLVDANPTGLRDTITLLSRYSNRNTNYEIIDSLIEEYYSDDLFDVVLCEGVIARQNDPEGFLQHIGRFVSPAGVLIISCCDSVSALGDTLRRLAGAMIVKPGDPIKKKMEILRPYFIKHLATLKGMSRPVDDWILDNIIQPFTGSTKLLPIKAAISALDLEFDVYGSSPQFFTDWRWYKDIWGENKKYNEIAFDLYHKNVHNLLDYRYVFEPQPIEYNKEIIKLCDSIQELLRHFETKRDVDDINTIKQNLFVLSKIVRKYSRNTSESIEEFALAMEEYQNAETFPHDLKKFAPFFGRGMHYLSFIRKG